MTFPWNCLMRAKSRSSFSNSPTLMLYKLVGSWMKEELSMFVSMDSPWKEYRSRESQAGVVVEVLGICILQLANLQCGQQRMVFMPGSGGSRNRHAAAGGFSPTVATRHPKFWIPFDAFSHCTRSFLFLSRWCALTRQLSSTRQRWQRHSR